MKILLYSVILLAVFLCPVTGTDVGELIPVEVVAISESPAGVMIRTDTGDMGEGKDFREALEDMKSSAAGIIYLDTAEYLILEEEMRHKLNAAQEHLKGSVRLCAGKGDIPLEGIADFLSVHRPAVKLKSITDSDALPEIREENGRYFLVEK